MRNAAPLHSIIFKPRVILIPETEGRNANNGVETRIKWEILLLKDFRNYTFNRPQTKRSLINILW